MLKTAVACPTCLAEGRGQRLQVDQECLVFYCVVHGPVLTAQQLEQLLGDARP